MSMPAANETSSNQELAYQEGKIKIHFTDALAKERLQVHKMIDLDQLFAKKESVNQRHRGRTVWNARIEDRKHNAFQVFVKLHEGKIPFIPRLSEIRNGLFRKPYPVREWEGIKSLERLGLGVPERLALFHETGRQFRAAVIVKEVAGRQSVYNMIENQSWASLGDELQSQILNQMMAVLHRIHEGGYGWRGVSSGHYYPTLSGDGRWILSIIDLEGIHPGATQSVVNRDFGKLLKCMKQYGGGDFAVNYISQMWKKRQQLELNLQHPAELSEAA